MSCCDINGTLCSVDRQIEKKSKPAFAVARLVLLLLLSFSVTSCSYWNFVARQAAFKEIHTTNPSQNNLKYIVNKPTFFVYGRVLDPNRILSDAPIVVAAFSNQYAKHEMVDYIRLSHAGTHYGMYLPPGIYSLVALADRDRNGVADNTEIIGRHRIHLESGSQVGSVVGEQDIYAGNHESVDWDIHLPLPMTDTLKESLFYPKGSIRNLDDPIFDADVATLGMYEPPAFLQRAPMLFYALEEDSYKIPVIFVHGIGGSARDFDSMLERLDKKRFQPWFFYYPSGSDLNQLANLFYDIFLSGRVNGRGGEPLVIVAHSMGGIIVREALNNYTGSAAENRLKLLITLSSPFNGHSAAAMAEKHGPLVLPSWRDLNPQSDFIKQLNRRPLSPEIRHVLIVTQLNRGKLIVGVRSDGVVSVESQLRPDVRSEAAALLRFHNSHAGVLRDSDAIAQIVKEIHQVESAFPPAVLQAMMAGGFDVELGSHYTAIEKHYIQTLGVYLSLLARGELDPQDDPVLQHFVNVIQGNAEADYPAEKAWLKFVSDYPDVDDWPLNKY